MVKTLDIGWIFENGGNVRKLIVALKDSPFETIFSTELVISLMEIFKDRYINHILAYCFIPYLIYFSTTVCFFTLFTSEGIKTDEDKVLAYIMGFVMIILDIYFFMYEIVVMRREGIIDYMSSDFFNHLDWMTSVLNAVLVFETLAEEEGYATSDRKTLKNWTAFAIILMWINLFDWFNITSPFFSIYWRVIKTTLLEIAGILVIFVLLLLGFGNALMILNEGRYDENEFFQDFFSNLILNTLMN